MENNCVLGTNLIVQVGIMVNDIEKTLESYCEFFGIENPGYVVTDIPEIAKTVYMGQPSECRCKQAFVDCGQLKIELIEPDHNPSAWRAGLDENGEGIHHIAFRVKGLEDTVERLNKLGYEQIQYGEWSKRTGGHYSYVDTREKMKFLLELLEDF